MAAKRVPTETQQSNFTMKFTPEERALLDKLIAARAKDLEEATGQAIEVSAAAYLRWLIERDAVARGLKKPAKK